MQRGMQSSWRSEQKVCQAIGRPEHVSTATNAITDEGEDQSWFVLAQAQAQAQPRHNLNLKQEEPRPRVSPAGAG